MGHIDLKQRNSISGLIKASLACIMHWAGLERAVWLVEFKTIPRKSTCFVWKRMGLAGGLGDPQNVWDLIIIIKYVVLFSYHCDKKNCLKKSTKQKGLFGLPSSEVSVHSRSNCSQTYGKAQRYGEWKPEEKTDTPWQLGCKKRDSQEQR